MKALMHETPVDSTEDIITKILVTVNKINTTPGVHVFYSQVLTMQQHPWMSL